MAIDKDGTQLFVNNSQQASTVLAGMNSEANAGINLHWSTTHAYVWMFPELRDLNAFFLGGRGGGSFSSFQWSANTTNGIDGTWSTVGTTSSPANAYQAPTSETFRTGITTLGTPITGIKAIRLTWAKISANNDGCLAFHLYGKPSAGENPNRLEFWHPTIDQSLNVTPAYLDWGDRPRSGVVAKQVRLKNLSATLAASSITIGVEALTDTSPTVVSQYALSLDGTTFTPTLTISTLNPGEVSSPIIVRQSLLDTAILSLWTQRLYARAGAWV